MFVTRLIVQRLVMALFTLLIVSFIIFAVLEILPGDVATRILGRDATVESIAALRERLHLNDPALLRYVVPKGSIAVDGVSLTVSALEDDAFSVSLIPETLERTNLGRAAPGATVNLEVDVLAKYVERLLGTSG